MVTTPRTTTVTRLLALAVACVVVVLVPAAVGTARARAADGPACAPSALLASQALPRRALAVLAAPGAPSCPEVASLATQRIHQAALLATSAAESADEKKWPDAFRDANASLAADRDNTAADELRTESAAEVAKAKAKVTAAAEAEKSWLEKLKDQWNSFFDEQLAPVSGLLLPFLGILFGLVVTARLVVLVVRQWPDADDLPDDRIRSALLVGGVLPVGASALLASLVAGDSNTDPLSRPMTWAAVLATWSAAGFALWVSQRVRQRAPGSSTLLLALSLGTVILALGGLLTRLLGGDEEPHRVDTPAVLGLATLLALQGVWLLAWWLATRIRLDVKGPTDTTDIGTVVALLSELGAEKPRGLEVPRGADVTALDGVLGSLPENPVLKVLKDIVRSISGVTPWTATIEGDAETRVVTVVRNGRTLGSAIVDPGRLGLTTDDDETATAKASSTTGETAAPDHTLKMAAAFVLCTMAQVHPSISRGLAGTTSWKSLGYQYVGSTTQLTASDTTGRDRQRALLARALDEDAENRSARLAFRHALDREATDCTTLSGYAGFLEDFQADLDGEHAFDTDALRLRAVYTRGLILVNAIYAHAAGSHGVAAGTECDLDPAATAGLAQDALKELHDLVSTPAVHTPDPLKEFRRRFADDVQGVLWLTKVSGDEPRPSSPTGMYNLGCTFASRHDVEWHPPTSAPGTRVVIRTTPLTAEQEKDDRTATQWLGLARQDPAVENWLGDDPQLSGFRTRRTYRTAFLTAPRTDFFTLATVKPFATRLRGAGYGDVSLLAAARPVSLARVVAGDVGLASQLVELARLRSGLATFTPVDDNRSRLVQAVHLALGRESADSLEAGLTAVLRVQEILRQGLADPEAAPGREAAAPLDRWAVEVLDQLTSLGLAHGDSLVALPVSRQSAVATKVVAALMETYQPEKTDDLDAYQSRLEQALAAWFRQPHEEQDPSSPPPRFR